MSFLPDNFGTRKKPLKGRPHVLVIGFGRMIRDRASTLENIEPLPQLLKLPERIAGIAAFLRHLNLRIHCLLDVVPRELVTGH